LWAVRRLIEQHHIIGHHLILGAMKPGVVDLNDMKIGRVHLRKVIEKLLKIFTVDPIVIPNHPFTGQRLHHPVEIERFELPLGFDERLDFF
jgi:hypothetical protein